MAIEPKSTTKTPGATVKLGWVGPFLAFRKTGNRAAIGYMLVTVTTWSMVPLFVNLADGSQTPFLFNAWLRMGLSFGCLLFLFVYYPGILLRSSSRSLIFKGLFSWPKNKPLFWVLLSTFDYAFFALSVKFLNIAVAAILFETWPIFVILLTARLFRDEERYQSISFKTVMLVFLSMLGFVFCHWQPNYQLSSP